MCVGAGAEQDVETAREYWAVAVKSGTIFSMRKVKRAEFQQLQARLKKLGKMFRYHWLRLWAQSSTENGQSVERVAEPKNSGSC